MRQKHLSIIILLGVVLVFLVSLAFASDCDDQCDYMPPPEFLWDGELNPNEFDKWEVISVQPTPQGLIWMFAKNPDRTSPIDIVAMEVDPKSTALWSYRYFKYGIPYSYVFDAEEDRYVRQHFTDEQRKGCMKCHSDKFVPQATVQGETRCNWICF